jgi:hypothetical protein
MDIIRGWAPVGIAQAPGNVVSADPGSLLGPEHRRSLEMLQRTLEPVQRLLAPVLTP